MSQDNRPSLTRFNYRIGTYGSIREFLFHQLDAAPALQTWTHRGPDDPAVALMEGASILGDILTFYQETYANEAFLRTARWRESVADLVRLLGYRLSPAVGGKALFAFEMRKDEPVTVPAAFPMKVPLAHFVKPAEFETTEEITAYPWLNRFNLYRPLVDPEITASTTEFYVSAPEQLLQPVVFKPGERLMIGEPSAAWPAQPPQFDRAEIVIVESVRELHGTKIVRIKGNLKRVLQVPSLAAYRIGRTFHHFGYNSPDQIVDNSEPVTSTATVATGATAGETETSSSIPYVDVPTSRPVRTVSGSFTEPTVSRSIETSEFPLDLELTDLPVKVPVVIQARFAHPFVGDAPQMFEPLPELRTLIRTIERVNTTTLSWGGAEGTVSEIAVVGPIHDSIGDGDSAARAAAQTALTNANGAVFLADMALGFAKLAASLAKANAEAAERAKQAADADLLSKEAKTLSAKVEAATMAVAKEMAGSALKDNPTDTATQAALDAAILALNQANDAKSKAATADTTALTGQTSATTARDEAEAHENWLTSWASVNPLIWPAVWSADWVTWDAELARQAAVNTKYRVGIARTAIDDTQILVNAARISAASAREAARIDANAVQRYNAAVIDWNAAKGRVTTAAGIEATARTAAINAAATVVTTAAAARAAVDALKAAIAALRAARKHAESKRIVSQTRMYIKDALFHEVTSALVTLKRAQEETTAPRGNILNFKGTVSQVKALTDRRIMLERPAAEPLVLSVLSIPSAFNAATKSYPVLHPIGLSRDVPYADFPNEKPIVTVLGNLADATEGKTLAEMPIGSGDASQIFQTFKLPKAPLTYHLVAGNTPPETPHVSIYVDGREWRQVESFFGHDQDERLYIVREDAAGNSWVQFGDGKSTSRLTDGVNNVTAVFRIGAGAYGPLKPDAKVQASARLKNLDTILMRGDVTGGGPPEGADSARYAAPRKVQSLGRIVSLRDFEAEAATIPGVASAAASWQLVDGIPAVEVTVLMETGRGDHTALDDVRTTLNTYNMQRGAGRDPVAVAQGRRLHVTVAVEYVLEPTYRADIVEAEIRRALGVNYARAARDESKTGLFSLAQRRFGGREYAASIAGHVQNVEGVRWAHTVVFAALSDADDPAAIIPPSASVLEPIVACDSRHVLSLYDTHLTLTAVGEAGQ